MMTHSLEANQISVNWLGLKYDVIIIKCQSVKHQMLFLIFRTNKDLHFKVLNTFMGITYILIDYSKKGSNCHTTSFYFMCLNFRHLWHVILGNSRKNENLWYSNPRPNIVRLNNSKLVNTANDLHRKWTLISLRLNHHLPCAKEEQDIR